MQQAYPSLAVGGRWYQRAHLMGPKLLYVVVPPLALSVWKVGFWEMGGKVGRGHDIQQERGEAYGHD